MLKDKHNYNITLSYKQNLRCKADHFEITLILKIIFVFYYLFISEN